MHRVEFVRLTRLEAAKILRAGVSAAADGSPVTACPYSAAGDGTERVRTAAWVRGFLSANRHRRAAANE